MERYSEYKDSGVQWLGEIPSHWALRRIKWLFKEEDEKNTNLSYQLLSFSRNKGIVPFSEINDKAPSASDLTKYKVIHKGQLLENRMQAWSGMFGCSHIEGCVSPDYSVFSAYDESVVTEYYAKLFRTAIFIRQFANASKGIGDGFNRLYTPQFQKIMAIYPPLSEQQAIVSYLDMKCSKLDTLVSNKEKEISLLSEMKQRIIADAVTRGLNPNVKFKATNIPCLPEIPEHWKPLRNKSFMKQTDEKVGKQQNVTLLSLTKQGVIVRDLSEGKGKFPKDFESYIIVKPKNLVFCLFDIDETPRTVGLVRNNGMLTGAYSNFQIDEKVVEPEFAYFYYLQVDDVKGLRPFYTGLRKVVKINTFSQLRIPVPPLSEQQAIVSYITERTAKIDSLVEKLNKEIECIKEYKQRLISDVVTGRIKVS